MTHTLHYIYDPLCGWCYAAAPLIKAAQSIEGLQIEMHAGGLWVDANVKAITPELRAYVVPNDERIHELSGQPFGDAYFNVLLNDSSAKLDSEPPIRAILAAQNVAQQGLAMLHRIQTAHYVEGLKVSERDTLFTLAHELGLPAEAFKNTYDTVDVRAHLNASRDLMAQSHAQGFPTMLLSHANDESGETQRINHGAFYGQADAFKAALQEAIKA